MSIDHVALIRARLPGVEVHRRRRPRPATASHPATPEVIGVDGADLVAVASFLRDDPDADCDLVDITAVDRFPTEGADTPRFTLVVLLRSRVHRTRAHLEVDLDDEDPAWPTLSGVWPLAHVLEREVFDLFGLFPDGHPNPRRLLLPDTFVGHPLRLDYRLDKAQPQVPPPAVQAPIVLPATEATTTTTTTTTTAAHASDAPGERAP